MKSEDTDDNTVVPNETQKKIVKFVKEILFPAVEAHIASKYPICFGCPMKIGDVHYFFIFGSYGKNSSPESSWLIFTK